MGFKYIVLLPILFIITLNSGCTNSTEPTDKAVLRISEPPTITGFYKTTIEQPEGTGEIIGNPSYKVNKINVFPNPYYGVNSEELNKYNRFVTINHLPQRATIRVFNLAGVLVQTITKDDPSQFTRWNLNNQSNLPVASGLYIAYIDMPDLGATKILKIAIIQEQQILDRF